MRLRPLVLTVFACFALNANAAIEQIYNWNGLEFVRSGNAHHVHPASPESTKLRGGWVLEISDVEPKATAKHDLPYANKGGALAKVTVTPSIDPKKVSSRVAQGVKNAAAGAATGNGYVAAGALACGLFDCGAAVAALVDWGIQSFNPDGSVNEINPSAYISNGISYKPYNDTTYYLSPYDACASYAASQGVPSLGYVLGSNQCILGGHWGGARVGGIQSSRSSSCSSGSYVHNKTCLSSDQPPLSSHPLEQYLNSRYMGKGWDHHWAKMTAEIVKNDGNVFTDGTSVGISGPAIVPLSSSETKTGVQLLPGTTAPAPSGHTGPTDSGTQTTTTTTSASNKFNPGPMSSGGSGSSGGPATGPTMTTTQTTTTTTSVTNNITNITNITNETTTEKEEAPEEAPTDTPFLDIPELYKQKYPDGLIGVMRTQFTAMKATPLFSLPMQLMGDLPQTGQCPSWQLDLSLANWASFGTYSVGADCSIWDFASWVIVISAFLLARQLVFGG